MKIWHTFPWVWYRNRATQDIINKTISISVTSVMSWRRTFQSKKTRKRRWWWSCWHSVSNKVIKGKRFSFFTHNKQQVISCCQRHQEDPPSNESSSRISTPPSRVLLFLRNQLLSNFLTLINLLHLICWDTEFFLRNWHLSCQTSKCFFVLNIYSESSIWRLV